MNKIKEDECKHHNIETIHFFSFIMGDGWIEKCMDCGKILSKMYRS